MEMDLEQFAKKRNIVIPLKSVKNHKFQSKARKPKKHFPGQSEVVSLTNDEGTRIIEEEEDKTIRSRNDRFKSVARERPKEVLSIT